MDKKIYWELNRRARCPECQSALAYIPIHNTTDIKFFCPHCEYVETLGGKHIDLPGKKIEKRTVTFEEVRKQESQRKKEGQTPWVLIFILLLALLFVLVAVDSESNPETSIKASALVEPSQVSDTKVLEGLTVKYLKSYFEDNGFKVITTKGSVGWITTAEMKISNSELEIIADIYHNSREKDIVLIDVTLDGSMYNESKQIEDQITEIASKLFSALAQIPYTTSKPEEAKVWVEKNINRAIGQGNVFDQKFGNAKHRLSGMPLMRFFEISTLSQ